MKMGQAAERERAMQNEMAAGWLELADTVLQPLKDWDVIKPE